MLPRAPLLLFALLAGAGAALSGAILSGAIPSDAKAQAHGDPAIGRQLAQQWCSGCHAVDGAAKATDAAPPLRVLLRGRQSDETKLRAWLHDPHPPMQGITLSRQQIEDVIAHLRRIAAE